MPDAWLTGTQPVLTTLNQILSAGIAITAFSLLLYALTFNLTDRVMRSFALILACVVIVFTAESIGSTLTAPQDIELFLRLQWVGIIILPPAYLHFSDALLATTGKPSRGRRRWAVRLTYLLSCGFLVSLPFPSFVGPLVMNEGPAPHLQPTTTTDIYTLCYLTVMIVVWINFVRTYRRTTTPTSQRRMSYLITGSLAPALGSFPFLLFGSSFAAQAPFLFWIVAVLSNLMVGVLLVMMAYSVSFFGVAWPDRVVKSRLAKWLMRGPFVASIALGLTTIVRRGGEFFGISYSAFVPIVMVAVIVVLEFAITLLAPLWERWLLYGSDREEIEAVRKLEERLLTRNDLRQFLEAVLAAVCDRLQSPGAYVAAAEMGGMELVAMAGRSKVDHSSRMAELAEFVNAQPEFTSPLNWQGDLLLPLLDGDEERENLLLGVMGVSGLGDRQLDEDANQALQTISRRAKLALLDRITQVHLFESLQVLSPQVDLIQRLRAVGQYDERKLLASELGLSEVELGQAVKEALVHYWGGPKLTESPLMQLLVVQQAAARFEGNQPNALRGVLREAIEKNRPAGERRYTGEWILYNILEMRFLEGRKIREIALRLAVSEADLYRKQRIAIDAVTKTMMEMEAQCRERGEVVAKPAVLI